MTSIPLVYSFWFMLAAYVVCSRQLPTQSSAGLSFAGNSSCLHPFICFANERY